MRGNVKEIMSLIRGIAGEDGGLDCGTIDDSLIRVDGIVGLLRVAIEEFGNKFDSMQSKGYVRLDRNSVECDKSTGKNVVLIVERVAVLKYGSMYKCSVWAKTRRGFLSETRNPDRNRLNER